MHFQGPAFIKFAAETATLRPFQYPFILIIASGQKMPKWHWICAFDSIMVDGSLFEEEESIAYVKSVVEKAKLKGITIEAELGRMEGGEDGLPTIDLEGVWTDPKKAKDFVERTGVHFLAPSFGNVHGPYPRAFIEYPA
jgi:fructose-bisphosphate aldolase class II